MRQNFCFSVLFCLFVCLFVCNILAINFRNEASDRMLHEGFKLSVASQLAAA